jgi:hypothetical protein
MEARCCARFTLTMVLCTCMVFTGIRCSRMQVLELRSVKVSSADYSDGVRLRDVRRLIKGQTTN